MIQNKNLALVAALLTLSAVSLQAQRPIRPDSLSGRELARLVLDHHESTRAAHSVVRGALYAVMTNPQDPRAEEARSVLVEALPALEPGEGFIRVFHLLVRFEAARPAWTRQTIEMAQRYITGDDRDKRFLVIVGLNSASEAVRKATAPIIAREIVNVDDPKRQRRLVEALDLLGEPGENEVDRLLASGTLHPDVESFVRYFRNRGGETD